MTVVTNPGTAIARPQRWDRPFGPDMTEADVERVLAQPIFRDIDAEQFPASLSLRDIIRNDARIQRLSPGDVIVREGDYGNSVFVVLSGRVRVVLDGTTDRELGRRTRRDRRSFWQALCQLWANPDQPEVRDDAAYRGGGDVNVRGTAENARTFIDDLDAFIGRHKTVALDAGEAFGEIAALARSPRTATVFAEGETEVVELRWQGLRDIRRRDRGFREHVDGLYRARSLTQHLAESPIFAHLDEATLQTIAEQTIFETHGTFEWFGSFKQVKQRDPSEVLEHEPVIAEEGHYLDGLMLIRSGFARITEQLDHGQRTVGYATKNDVFGLEEVLRHVRHGEELCLRRSLRAVGYVDILRVPTALIEEYVLPTAPPSLLPRTEADGGKDAMPAWAEQCSDLDMEQSLVDFLVDNRTINGTATMLIDTDRCTSCDDCVRACAAAHNNNPRFRRHGPIHENLQVTNACMHCADPVCLIGCPTGAIHRHPSGPVVIDDATCIGCGTCANSCPYDNISMVEIRDAAGDFIVDSATNQPIVKATKCDLCYEQLGGPACQRACPHDALIRIDMRDRETLAKWVNRK
jgi:Fe-S-cluster-containing dehydrogenase component/CRP-like cAMP-binding protein